MVCEGRQRLLSEGRYSIDTAGTEEEEDEEEEKEEGREDGRSLLHGGYPGSLFSAGLRRANANTTLGR